jgi:N-acetylglucosamine kinase-like BadF-type ATPase
MGETGAISEGAYFLGFDGGGSKTECVIASADGRILGRSTAGPSNPMRAGFTRAWFSLSEAADVLLARQQITSVDIRGICAGIGGAARTSVARRLTTFFQRSFPKADVEVATDFEIAFEAAFGAGEGIILDAGTGSFAFGRDASGRKERAGGRGPWFSDEGSGFDIGRRAVAAALLAEENRGPSTSLNGTLFAFLEVRNWNSLIDHVSKDPDALFPRVFPLVAQLADSGDEVSRDILSTAAASLAGLASSVAEKLGWHGTNPEPGAKAHRREIPIARIGGMHGRSAFFDAALDAALTHALPNRKYVELSMTPAEAAVKIASRARKNASSA